MPCYITGTLAGDLQLTAQENATTAREVTDLLCQLCKAFEEKQPMPVEVVNWWQSHKQIDSLKK